MASSTIRAPEIRVCDASELVDTAAKQIASDMADAITRRGVCRIALAGGGTPRPIYQKLAQSPLADDIDWNKVHFFWGDERCVPPEHESSNYQMTREAWLDHIVVPADNIHRIKGELAPGEAARDYAAQLADQRIDIMLLGMGGDGHTASLFPDTENLAGETARVVATKSPVAPADRVSLTLRALNEARLIYFIISGASKADRLVEVYEQIASGSPSLPAAHVQPTSGKLIWLVDTAAAAALPSAPDEP